MADKATKSATKGVKDEIQESKTIKHIPLPDYLTRVPRIPELSEIQTGFTHNTRNGPGRSGNPDPDRHCYYPSRGGRGAMKCDACYDYNKRGGTGVLLCMW